MHVLRIFLSQNLDSEIWPRKIINSVLKLSRGLNGGHQTPGAMLASVSRVLKRHGSSDDATHVHAARAAAARITFLSSVAGKIVRSKCPFGVAGIKLVRQVGMGWSQRRPSRIFRTLYEPQGCSEGSSDDRPTTGRRQADDRPTTALPPTTARRQTTIYGFSLVL